MTTLWIVFSLPFESANLLLGEYTYHFNMIFFFPKQYAAKRLSKTPDAYLRQEGANGAFHDASADGTFAQRWGTLLANHQVSTGNKNDVDLLIHANFASALLLESPQLLFHW